jgi:hypothetical protein
MPQFVGSDLREQVEPRFAHIPYGVPRAKVKLAARHMTAAHRLRQSLEVISEAHRRATSRWPDL